MAAIAESVAGERVVTFKLHDVSFKPRGLSFLTGDREIPHRNDMLDSCHDTSDYC